MTTENTLKFEDAAKNHCRWCRRPCEEDTNVCEPCWIFLQSVYEFQDQGPAKSSTNWGANSHKKKGQ